MYASSWIVLISSGTSFSQLLGVLSLLPTSSRSIRSGESAVGKSSLVLRFVRTVLRVSIRLDGSSLLMFSPVALLRHRRSATSTLISGKHLGRHAGISSEA